MALYCVSDDLGDTYVVSPSYGAAVEAWQAREGTDDEPDFVEKLTDENVLLGLPPADAIDLATQIIVGTVADVGGD